MFIRGLTFIFLLVLLVACATNPVTGRKQLMLISEKQSISASREAYVKMLEPLEEDGKINSDPELTKRINLITAKLIAQALIYRPETVNAFCMAGGKMAIYTGLVEQLDATDDELAQVMGHEIAHALSAHTAERMSIALATNLAVTGFALTRDQPGVALAGASLAAALAIQLPNSRQSESEADVIGIELAARAGYDPHAAVSLWEKMAKVSGNDSNFDFLSTHPAPAKRMEKLGELIPEMMPLYEAKGERPLYPLKSD
jgi:predicted Zn-dependent protease